MIEFKQDTASGRYFLMEVNPRFWGSLQLAIDSGVDFPADLVALSRGTQVPHCHSWRLGRQSRWVLGELDHILARLRHSKAALHLPPDSEPLLGAVLSFLFPWRIGLRGDVLRLSDPLPALREVRAWFQELAGAS